MPTSEGSCALNTKALTIRIVAGKLFGFVIGLCGFALIALSNPDFSISFAVGIALWYGIVGAVIGMSGVYDRHPAFNIPLRWYTRGSIIGGSMNLVLTLLTYDQLQLVMSYSPYLSGLSPWWMIAEGALIGMILDFVCTRYSRESVPGHCTKSHP